MAPVPRDRKDIGLVTVLRPIMTTPADGRHPRAMEGVFGGGVGGCGNGRFHILLGNHVEKLSHK
jgi:hypothetical protein